MKFNITHFKTVNCKFYVNDLIKSLQYDHISCDRVTFIKCYYIYNIDSCIKVTIFKSTFSIKVKKAF